MDPYINIVWIQDELDPCTKELWTWSYNWPFAIKQIGYGWILLLTYTLTQLIVLEVTIYVYGSKIIHCVITVSRHDLVDHKHKNGVATDLFCTGVIGHPGCMFLD